MIFHLYLITPNSQIVASDGILHFTYYQNRWRRITDEWTKHSSSVIDFITVNVEADFPKLNLNFTGDDEIILDQYEELLTRVPEFGELISALHDYLTLVDDPLPALIYRSFKLPDLQWTVVGWSPSEDITLIELTPFLMNGFIFTGEDWDALMVLIEIGRLDLLKRALDHGAVFDKNTVTNLLKWDASPLIRRIPNWDHNVGWVLAHIPYSRDPIWSTAYQDRYNELVALGSITGDEP